ncbi:hypothetical protein FGRMN_6351 [Fusarium graminum]|nr:hypothetical protein FGRMN_6351 [Fusarium graminum]
MEVFQEQEQAIMPLEAEATLDFIKTEEDRNYFDGSTIVLHDMKSTGIPQAYHEDGNTYTTHGIKVIKMRHQASDGFQNGAKVLAHIDQMARQIQWCLELQRTPICVNADIVYGIINPTNANMAIRHISPVMITVGQDVPSSLVKMGFTNPLARISHPLTAAMKDYPHVVCDPSTLVPSRDYLDEISASGGPGVSRHLKHHERQSWIQLNGQQPWELLVRRAASSDEGNTAIAPIVSANVTGNGHAQPEDRMTVRFVVWKLRI